MQEDAKFCSYCGKPQAATGGAGEQPQQAENGQSSTATVEQLIPKVKDFSRVWDPNERRWLERPNFLQEGMEHNQHPSASPTHATLPEENEGPSFLEALGADAVDLGVSAGAKFAGGYILGWLIIGLLGAAAGMYEFCAYFGWWFSLATAAGICGWVWGVCRIMKRGTTAVQVAFWLNIVVLLFLRSALGEDSWPAILALLAIGTVLYSIPFGIPK